MFIDFFVGFSLGTTVGIFVGLFPGVGITSVLLLFSPFLVTQSFIVCLAFYAAISAASQYFGSITAIAYKIPGENTAFPILDALKNNQAPSNLYFLTALGSFLGSLVSLFLMFFLFKFIISSIFYLKTWFIMIFGSIGFLLCVGMCRNKISINLAFCVLGWMLGKIGIDTRTNTTFLTFDNPYLYGGIPSFPFLMGLYAIPALINTFHLKPIYQDEVYTVENLKESVYHLQTILRSSVIGFISGLIPFFGNTMSSYIAYFIDQKDKSKNFVSNIIASETANNSANISVLIPLLFLGIAITPSEFFLLEIINFAYQIGNMSTVTKFFYEFFIALIIINIICFVISAYFHKRLSLFFIENRNYSIIFLLLTMILSNLLIGSRVDQGLYYFIILALSAVMGFLLRNFDLLPVVYCFLLQSNLESVIIRFINLYF